MISLLLLTLFPTLSTAATTCTSNANCPISQSCIGGHCIATGKQNDPCTSNSDCVPPYLCINNGCTLPSSLTTTTVTNQPTTCTSNANCPVSQSCIGGHCIGTGKQNDPCTSNSDCMSPFVCINNGCTLPSSITTTTVTNQPTTCISNSDCSPSQFCLNGFCSGTGNEGHVCTTDAACIRYLKCINGRCTSSSSATTTTISSVTTTTTSTSTQSTICTMNADCSPQRFCYDGICSGTGLEGTPCTTTTECLLTLQCIDGMCILPSVVKTTTVPSFTTTTIKTTTAPTPCRSLANCAINQDCIDGFCRGIGGQGALCLASNACLEPLTCVNNMCTLVLSTTSTTTTTTTTTTPKPSCGKGWFQYENYCFYPIHGAFTHAQGKEWCGDAKSELVTIPNAAVNEYINFAHSAGGISPYWIGLRKIDKEWVWPNGTVAIYTNWRPGQPDGCCGKDVTCAVADYSNARGLWDDAGCGAFKYGGEDFGFVCEKLLSE